jgi:hypothetical protein
MKDQDSRRLKSSSKYPEGFPQDEFWLVAEKKSGIPFIEQASWVITIPSKKSQYSPE